jgi:hypothetical protein
MRNPEFSDADINPEQGDLPTAWFRFLAKHSMRVEMTKFAQYMGGRVAARLEELNIEPNTSSFYNVPQGDVTLLVAVTPAPASIDTRLGDVWRLTVNRRDRNYDTPGSDGGERYHITDYVIDTRRPRLMKAQETVEFPKGVSPWLSDDSRLPPLILKGDADHYYLYPGLCYELPYASWSPSHTLGPRQNYFYGAQEILDSLSPPLSNEHLEEQVGPPAPRGS